MGEVLSPSLSDGEYRSLTPMKAIPLMVALVGIVAITGCSGGTDAINLPSDYLRAPPGEGFF